MTSETRAVWQLTKIGLQCSDLGQISGKISSVIKPFEISSSGDQQNSADEYAESNTDRYNQQYTYTHTHP